MSTDTLVAGQKPAAIQLPLRTDRMIATKEGAVGWIVFNNPARRNAVSVAMWEALREIVEDYAHDDSIRVIVVRGAGGKAFVSGADISEFEQQRSTPQSTEAYRQLSEAATMALHHVDKPTIAMIEGFCIGGGVSLALSCDIRIAESGARFGVPAARLGLGYELPGVRKLVDIVGPSFAKEIFFTARQFSSNEAREMGLVNRVVSPETLEDYVREYAATIADNAPLTVTSIKTIVGEILKDDDKRNEALCDQVVDRCFNSEDYIEGRRAFMEKRAARFTGR
jgi:enoyl-CoA hydratase/carnithine racemase